MHSWNKRSSLLQNSNFINNRVLYVLALDCIVSQATSNLVFFIITTVSCRHVRCRSALKPVTTNETSSVSVRMQVYFVNGFENIGKTPEILCCDYATSSWHGKLGCGDKNRMISICVVYCVQPLSEIVLWFKSVYCNQ
jgi:hypothetical protein